MVGQFTFSPSGVTLFYFVLFTSTSFHLPVTSHFVLPVIPITSYFVLPVIPITSYLVLTANLPVTFTSYGYFFFFFDSDCLISFPKQNRLISFKFAVRISTVCLAAAVHMTAINSFKIKHLA